MARDADIGVIFAAWWLHRMHGEDTYAVGLLREWCGRGGLRRLQRIATQEGYDFKRGFWSEAKREVAA